MQTTVDIKHLSRIEKLRVMEALWEELFREDEEVGSPGWHQKALQETERRISTGQEKIIDWQDAKKELRKQFE